MTFHVVNPEQPGERWRIDVDGDGFLEAVSLVTHQRGTWRWQDAYAAARYSPRLRRKRGKGKSLMVWMSHGSGRKMSLPQAERAGYVWPCNTHGSLNQQPVPAFILQALSSLEDIGAGRAWVYTGSRSQSHGAWPPQWRTA